MEPFPRVSEASDAQLEKVMRQIIDAKMELVVLRKKRRILLEEIHRQFLEGECEPKKRIKSLNDVKKRKTINANYGVLQGIHDKQQHQHQEIKEEEANVI
eukprot:gene22185-28723_t